MKIQLCNGNTLFKSFLILAITIGLASCGKKKTDDSKAVDAYQKLIDKPGRDFDKAYCDMMVDGHKKAVDRFESAAADSKDSDIRSWANSMLPILRSHLDHAMVCQAKCTKG